MTKSNSAWTGMVPVADTALAVTDTNGPGTPVIYLNGSYTSQPGWRCTRVREGREGIVVTDIRSVS